MNIKYSEIKKNNKETPDKSKDNGRTKSDQYMAKGDYFSFMVNIYQESFSTIFSKVSLAMELGLELKLECPVPIF